MLLLEYNVASLKSSSTSEAWIWANNYNSHWAKIWEEKRRDVTSYELTLNVEPTRLVQVLVLELQKHLSQPCRLEVWRLNVPNRQVSHSGPITCFWKHKKIMKKTSLKYEGASSILHVHEAGFRLNNLKFECKRCFLLQAYRIVTERSTFFLCRSH
jgi:hypothetical protein